MLAARYDAAKFVCDGYHVRGRNGDGIGRSFLAARLLCPRC
jgi:hypothetical protein